MEREYKKAFLFVVFWGISFGFGSELNAQQLFEVMEHREDIKLFVETLQNAGLDEELNENGPYTIFVPNNDAFQKVKESSRLNNPERVRELMLDHMITGMATKRYIKAMSRATSLGGIVLKMKVENDEVRVNNARIVTYNIRAENGMIHIIDDILE